MKKTLLASTALVGASLVAAPASAGQVGSKDAYSVSLGGVYIFTASTVDEDGANESSGDPAYGQDRGYKLATVESEVHVNARATADNGMKYGVSIELNAGAGDETAADEAWAFLDSDSWGRLEMGDQDDVTNRMQFSSFNAHKGFNGPAGGLGMLGSVWHGLGAETILARADYQNNGLTTLDSTKLNYFTPRFEGFQIGMSFTPDSGANSGNTGEADNNGSTEEIFSIAANYVGKFDDVGIGLSVERMVGDIEPNPGAVAGARGVLALATAARGAFGTTYTAGTHNSLLALGGYTENQDGYDEAVEDLDDAVAGAERSLARTEAGNDDLDIWGFGGKVDFAGVTLAAHYRDLGETGRNKLDVENGADAGSAWSVGIGYSSGPWGVSAWYTDAEKDNVRPAPQTTVERLGFGAGYTVAPGWLMRADLEFLDHENIGGDPKNDNDGTGFLLTNMFLF